MMMNLMTILVKKVFISSKPTFVYLLCPPLCGPFSIQESAAGGLSYKEKNGISMQVTIQMADPPVIPETEFCVLVGNLLENAVDACADTDAEIQSFIRLHVVQTGSSMLSITADNTSSGSPNWSGDKLLSTKHSGYGIGTESIRMIAERYSGDARFRWKDGIFYASVMLNPQV